MRYLMMVKASENQPPSPELYAAVGKLGEEMTKAGVLLDQVGLMPSARGGRIRLSGGTMTATDGPFAEAKEVIGGFGILKAGSREEAMELGRRFVQLHRDVMGPAFEMELEIRELMEFGAPG
jgi:hypothetical protein